jgi:hypothetical protein
MGSLWSADNRGKVKGVASIDTVIATMKPDETHWARSWFSVKCWLISGMATFTTVDDMIEAMVPTITDIRSSQR